MPGFLPTPAQSLTTSDNDPTPQRCASILIFTPGITAHLMRPGDLRLVCLAQQQLALETAGGVSRLAFHGVLPLVDGTHALLGQRRINLTFRQAG